MSLWSPLRTPACRWRCHRQLPQGRRWQWEVGWLNTRSRSEGRNSPPGKGEKRFKNAQTQNFQILYDKSDILASSKLGDSPVDPLVRPPIMYTLSRQVTAACMVLGFNMAGAGVQVRVTGQKHQTSSVASWDGSATCSRIARQQLPRQPPVTKIYHRNVINASKQKQKPSQF